MKQLKTLTPPYLALVALWLGSLITVHARPSVTRDYGLSSQEEDARVLALVNQRKVQSQTVNLDCSLPAELVDEIASYQEFANDVSNLVLNGPLKGVTYNTLATFVDRFGSRLTGSDSFDNAVDYMVNYLRELGLENSHTEEVNVPIWTRGTEQLVMLQPRVQDLTLLGVGSSVGTPLGGITAEIIVVDSFEELVERQLEVPGKIVVYNENYTTYGDTVSYRSNGASMAAKYGGVAALIRSVTPYSIYSPHTGYQYYNGAISAVQIPAACITVEDAEMFKQLQDAGTTVVLRLTMDARNYPDAQSRNTVAELVGSTLPDEVVIVSGHLDSWDVGQGAMDDGGGVYISLMAPYVVKQLNLRPRRTLRTVLWTSEEFNYDGAVGYSLAHFNELDNFNIVMESDDGTFDPQGLSVTSTNEAACMIQEIMKLTSFLNATDLQMPGDGSDTEVFEHYGVPVANLMINSEKYFNFHHSHGDMMTVLDPDELDRCLVFWTVTSYVLADLSMKLPRDNSTIIIPS